MSASSLRGMSQHPRTTPARHPNFLTGLAPVIVAMSSVGQDPRFTFTTGTTNVPASGRDFMRLSNACTAAVPDDDASAKDLFNRLCDATPAGKPLSLRAVNRLIELLTAGDVDGAEASLEVPQPDDSGVSEGTPQQTPWAHSALHHDTTPTNAGRASAGLPEPTSATQSPAVTLGKRLCDLFEAEDAQGGHDIVGAVERAIKAKKTPTSIGYELLPTHEAQLRVMCDQKVRSTAPLPLAMHVPIRVSITNLICCACRGWQNADYDAMMERIDGKRYQYNQVMNELRCKQVGLPANKTAPLEESKLEFFSSVAAMYGLELPTDIETEAEVDRVLQPYRRKQHLSLGDKANALQLSVYMGRYDHRDITQPMKDDFLALTRAAAFDVLNERSKLPSLAQMELLLDAAGKLRLPQSEIDEIVEVGKFSTARMQTVTEALLEQVKRLGGRYTHTR